MDCGNLVYISITWGTLCAQCVHVSIALFRIASRVFRFTIGVGLGAIQVPTKGAELMTAPVLPYSRAQNIHSVHKLRRLFFRDWMNMDVGIDGAP